MTEEYRIQTNDLFYNVTHRGTKVSDASLTELLAMRSGLDAIIKEKKQQVFEKRVKELEATIEAFKNDFPNATWYVTVENNEGCMQDHDLFNLMDFTDIEP